MFFCSVLWKAGAGGAPVDWLLCVQKVTDGVHLRQPMRVWESNFAVTKVTSPGCDGHMRDRKMLQNAPDFLDKKPGRVAYGTLPKHMER